MAIRVEFYAEDQVTASSIVEFALSKGAVLQSYSEIAPPMKRPAKAPSKPGKAARTIKKLRLSPTTFLKCVNSDNPFRESGARWRATEVIIKHNEPILYTSLFDEIYRTARIEPENLRTTIHLLIDKGHVEITHK